MRIIGGGFSALTLAEALAERKVPFELFEASSEMGGIIRTEKLGAGISESAANGILWSQELEDLCQRLGLSPVEPQKTAKTRWIFKDGKARRWPVGLAGTLNILKFLMTFKLNPRSLRPREGQSLKDYGLSNLGSDVTLSLLQPAMHGIYGPAFRELSANLILGKFFDPLRKAVKPKTVSFPGGMADLINALAVKARKHGAVFTGRKINLKDIALNAGPVVICTALPQTMELLRERYPDALPMGNLPSSGLISVTVVAESEKNQKQGFGCLFGDLKESEGVMGVLFNSEIFIGRARANLRSETWIIDYRRGRELSDADLVSVIMAARESFFNCKSQILETKIWRWPEAIPIYSTDLEKWLQKLGPYGERALAGTPVRIHGNFMGEIGLSSILKRSQILAEKLERMQ